MAVTSISVSGALTKFTCCITIARSNLSYDGKRVRWLNDDFELLKTFIAVFVNESGKWPSPGGKSKKFTSSSSDLIITWYYGKQRTLLFQGKSGEELRETLTSICGKRSLPINTVDNPTSDGDGPLDESAILSEFGSSSLTSTVVENCKSANVGIIKEHAKSPIDYFITQGKTTYPGGVCDKVNYCYSCSCDRTSTELDDVKLNIEVLQLRVDSLQALANTQKICTPEDE